MHADLENHMVLGDPEDYAGTIELDRPESQEELLTLLRERIPHKEYDDIWHDVLIQMVPGGQRSYGEWLELIFDRVRDDDLLELGRQTHELRQSMRKAFIRSADVRKYGIYWEDQE